MITVAALYVERGGPYFGMPDVDPWGKERDARTYDGPHPVVAHPPCGPWGRLHHLYHGDEHDCAPAAVASVRRWGGVLEHPAHSGLWKALCLPWPDGLPDAHGGFTISIDQCAWGHVARKRSWLYVVGASRASVLAGVRVGGTPTHWISGFHWSGLRPDRPARDAAPPGIKICSSRQRRRTPPQFATWLVGLARSTRGDQAALEVA